MTKFQGEKGYKILTPFARILFKLIYHPKIINKEFIPKEGPIIIACNHKHILDQFLTICATKRIIHYMAKKEYFDGKFAWFFKLVGCIPVNRSIKDQEAKCRAMEILNDDGAIGIFPEGTRNKDNKTILLPFKYGTVSMAKKTNALIIPCAITGDYKFRNNNLIIRYGQPFYANMSLEEANDKLYKEIKRLLKKNLKETNRSLKEELKTHKKLK